MTRLEQILFTFVFALALPGVAAAQDNIRATAQRSSVTITASASAERVRITAPASVVRMHIEVFAASGEKLFDNEIRGGNVFDWHLQDGQGQHLSVGDYVCVVTVKNIAGRITQKIGAVRMGEKDVSVQPAAQLSSQQSQAIGPVEENSSWTVLKENENQTTTVIAHDGSDGQVTRGRGALSFRLGDFFSGNDKEQMRLTEEGNLGIGTAKPRVKLDVAGTVRAQQGFMFNDGSTLNVNEKGALILTASDGTVAPNTAGTGTQNHLAKWLETGGAGTLGDSSVTELANGFVGIGTTNPQVRLDVVDDTSGVGGFQLTNHTNGSTAQLQNRLANNTGAFAYYGITSSGYTQAPILSNRAFFGSFQADTVIWTQSANDILFATNGLSTATERMRIKSNGNVGIGTTAPVNRLSVGGYADFSGRVGIGTASPLHKLEVVGGDFGGNALITDNNTTATTVDIGNSSASGRTWRLQSVGSGVAGRVGNFEIWDAAFGFNVLTIQPVPVGNVGIGTTTPTHKLEVNGSVAGVGPYQDISDARYKKNIFTLTEALDKILLLRGVSYEWRREENPAINFNSGRQVGFIAQEVEKVLPEAVTKDENGSYRLAYSAVVPLLVEAVKQQQQTITKLQQERCELKTILTVQQSRLAALEHSLRRTKRQQ